MNNDRGERDSGGEELKKLFFFLEYYYSTILPLE